MARIEALFIDWDGTMCTDKFWGQWELNQPELYQRVQTYLFEDNKELVGKWMVGDFKAGEVVSRIGRATSINSMILSEGLIKSCKNMKLVSEDVWGLVKNIRDKGINVAIATDNMDTFTDWTVPSLGLHDHFDGILNSYDLKVSKRKGDVFFGKYLAKNNLNPHGCVMIDDREDRDGILTAYGFNYRKIKTGVVDELKNVLQEL